MMNKKLRRVARQLDETQPQETETRVVYVVSQPKRSIFGWWKR